MTKQTLLLTLMGLGFYQIAYTQQFSVGIQGGILVTNVDKSPLEQNEPAPQSIAGYQVSIPVEIAIGDVFAIQPEIMLGSHGGRQEGTSTVTQPGISTTTTMKARYSVGSLEIPILAKARFGTEALKFHVLAGPSIGFGLDGKYNTETNIEIVSILGVYENLSSADYKARFLNEGYKASELGSNEFAVSKINLNLHFGAGLSVYLGGPSLFLDARYILGLNDLHPEAEGDTHDISYKSKRIGVSVGVMFPLWGG